MLPNRAERLWETASSRPEEGLWHCPHRPPLAPWSAHHVDGICSWIGWHVPQLMMELCGVSSAATSGDEITRDRTPSMPMYPSAFVIPRRTAAIFMPIGHHPRFIYAQRCRNNNA